jgi:hypothetical protein
MISRFHQGESGSIKPYINLLLFLAGVLLVGTFELIGNTVFI